MRKTYNEFPDDNVKRVIISYGKINHNNGIPTVSVHTKRLDSEEKENYWIPLKDLRDVKIGSIVKNGEVQTGYHNDYGKYGYVENVQFDFCFTDNEPVNVVFEKVENDEYGFGKEHPYDRDAISELKPKNNTVYAKLVTKDGTAVYIPSLELLVSGYTLWRKLMIFLCKYPFKIAMGYINQTYRPFYGCTPTRKGYSDQRTDCSDHLKFNSISRIRASRIWISQYFTKSQTGSYIAVLPYQPVNMAISASGIWLNDRAFLVHRIEKLLPAKNLIFDMMPPKKDEIVKVDEHFSFFEIESLDEDEMIEIAKNLKFEDLLKEEERY